MNCRGVSRRLKRVRVALAAGWENRFNQSLTILVPEYLRCDLLGRSFLPSVRQLRERARLCRQRAEVARSIISRANFLAFAREYERLATSAEERERDTRAGKAIAARGSA